MPPLQHLVSLVCGKEVVEEHAVGELVAILLKVRMRRGEWQEFWLWKKHRFFLCYKIVPVTLSFQSRVKELALLSRSSKRG